MHNAEEEERMQEVMDEFISQAGVDYETRPMLVICASAFPNPKEVNYDKLFNRIVAYLDLYVESDYTVVLLAAGSQHQPPWSWVWQAYRTLNRKYRKNLKRLYVVHSNWFSKMLFSLAGAVISPKFFRKITYISTLSELAVHVPLTQIPIPAPVYQENSKHETRIQLPVQQASTLFGVSLTELMGESGEKGGLPRVLKESIAHLRSTVGLTSEGLFRRSPSSLLLKQAAEAYDRDQAISLHTFADPNVAAVLIKKFLRDLPEPLFPESMYPLIRKCPFSHNDNETVQYIRSVILPAMPSWSAVIVLSSVLHLLHDVSLKANENKMNSHNLAIVICPNLVSSPNPLVDVQMCAVTGGTPSKSPLVAPTQEGTATLGNVIKFCIERYYEIFDELQDRSEAVRPISFPEAEPRTSFDTGRSDEIDDGMLVMSVGPSKSTDSVRSARKSLYSLSLPSRPPTGISPSLSSPTFSSFRATKPTGRASTQQSPGASVTRGANKSLGSPVEATGITASGFFTPSL
ncbi:Rho GTPase activation protein [Sistotremastrum niveocremeum HHB9708]|uniref:Rho GTPase activation protein n=1 Tax=Sistotremastrum niveocremeum HHB9708 TaxID=1314777 RepID=A0A164XL00_9AGAM|nr:Rho GTPase activation protein [Sistotremastrum niveocremeum HHB9708]